MNLFNPNLMTTKERLGEVYAILGRGMVRLRLREEQLAARESDFQLHFSPDQSGGVNPPTRRTR